MIYYLSRRKTAYTLAIQVYFYPERIGNRVRLLPYETLFRLPRLPVGTYIFTDFDRLDGKETECAVAIWNAIGKDPAFRRLNDPGAVRQRFALLRSLHDAGLNSFNVYRLDEWQSARRIPVFIRRERGHHRPLTGLIDDRDSLEAAVTRLRRRRDHADLMIVEFANETGADGRYRKYGAIRVGDAIYGQHVMIRDDWYVKGTRHGMTQADRDELESYISDNPHAEQLRPLFDLAGIDYGRIDYGIIDGRIQTYEINTNPTINAYPLWFDRQFKSSRFADLHVTAMLAIDVPGNERTIPNPIASRPLPDHASAIERAHTAALARVFRSAHRHIRKSRPAPS